MLPRLKAPHTHRVIGTSPITLAISEGDISQWRPTWRCCATTAMVTSANQALQGRQPTYQNWWKFSGKKNSDSYIHQAAGPKLLRACLRLKELEPGTGIRCRVGQAYTTPAFEMTAVDWIIHAVAPEYEQFYLHENEVGTST